MGEWGEKCVRPRRANNVYAHRTMNMSVECMNGHEHTLRITFFCLAVQKKKRLSN